MNEVISRMVHEARIMAMTYVWGWQDALGGEKSTIESEAFADAYAQHELEFRTGQRYCVTNIPHAWQLWLAGKPIE